MRFVLEDFPEPDYYWDKYVEQSDREGKEWENNASDEEKLEELILNYEIDDKAILNYIYKNATKDDLIEMIENASDKDKDIKLLFKDFKTKNSYTDDNSIDKNLLIEFIKKDEYNIINYYNEDFYNDFAIDYYNNYGWPFPWNK